MREFEQMEMQFSFTRNRIEIYENGNKTSELAFALGLGQENYKFHDHEKLAHYANAAADIEFKFPFGFKRIRRNSLKN